MFFHKCGLNSKNHIYNFVLHSPTLWLLFCAVISTHSSSDGSLSWDMDPLKSLDVIAGVFSFRYEMKKHISLRFSLWCLPPKKTVNSVAFHDDNVEFRLMTDSRHLIGPAKFSGYWSRWMTYWVTWCQEFSVLIVAVTGSSAVTMSSWIPLNRKMVSTI